MLLLLELIHWLICKGIFFRFYPLLLIFNQLMAPELVTNYDTGRLDTIRQITGLI